MVRFKKPARDKAEAMDCLTTRCTLVLKQRFEALCEAEGLKVSEALRQLVEQACDAADRKVG